MTITENLTTKILSTFLLLFAFSSANAKNISDKTVEGIAQVRLALTKDLPSRSISVNAESDILQVVGFVDNREQLVKLLEIVSKYEKRYYIVNNVLIAPKGIAEDDNSVAQRVTELLKEMKYPSNGISVQARDGMVLLGGFVDPNIILPDITFVAYAVPGVVNVSNFIMKK